MTLNGCGKSSMTTAASAEISGLAEQAEKELLTVLALKEPTYAEIDALIAKYRTAAEDFLLNDFTAAAGKNTGIRLWNAHGKINSKYRSHLAKFRDAEGQKRPVERRKLEKHYLDFIKSSMRFYRGYIQRLATHFQSPKEVLEIAHKFRLDILSVDPVTEPSQQETQLILKSCHATLVSLGDLSRYRETELQTKQRNWAPAVGYYDLATAIDPSSGASHHQLAVIARTDGSHVRVLYHLYRALSVQTPYPRARENLETELKKILDRKNRNQLIPQTPEKQPGVVLQAWFVYLHARFHAGVDVPEHEELENEVLGNLSVELKERPLDGLLNKFALSSIAAQHLARTRAAELKEDTFQDPAFILFLCFNIKTFFTLLQILLPELEKISSDNDALPGSVPSHRDSSETIGATARRILPCLRHYSSWLVSHASDLVALESHEFVGVQVIEFWRIYADTLSQLAAIFQKSDLPNVEYLLEEDEDTVAFTPFMNQSTSRRYLQADGLTPKRRSRDEGVQRHHPSVEMLFRIKGLLEDCFALLTRQNDFEQAQIPLMVVDESRVEFRERGLPLDSNYNKSHAHSRSAASINRDDIERAKQNSRPLRHTIDNAEDASESVTPSVSTNTAMHRMVDGLVASEPSENHEPRPRFPQISHGEAPPMPAVDVLEGDAFEGSQNGPKTSAGPLMEKQENILPALPSIWNSPFTPRPGETGSPDARPGTAHKYPVATPNTPIPQSSYARFHEALLRQQQELEMRQSSLCDLPTTSLTQTASSALNTRSIGRDESPIPSPFTPSPSIPPATFSRHDISRQMSQPSRYGAVGQIQPSSQGE